MTGNLPEEVSLRARCGASPHSFTRETCVAVSRSSTCLLERNVKHAGLRWTKDLLATVGVFLVLPYCWAGEGPFFITYTHQMEEPRNLEFRIKNVTGKPGDGDRFLGSALEFEYGLKGWWTTELYLDGQATNGEGALFTGYRWENRFRLLRREHWINPVFYFEFENITARSGQPRWQRRSRGTDWGSPAGEEERAGSEANPEQLFQRLDDR